MAKLTNLMIFKNGPELKYKVHIIFHTKFREFLVALGGGKLLRYYFQSDMVPKHLIWY